MQADHPREVLGHLRDTMELRSTQGDEIVDYAAKGTVSGARFHFTFLSSNLPRCRSRSPARIDRHTSQ